MSNEQELGCVRGRGRGCTCDDKAHGGDPFIPPPIDPDCPIHGVEARRAVLERQ